MSAGAKLWVRKTEYGHGTSNYERVRREYERRREDMGTERGSMGVGAKIWARNAKYERGREDMGAGRGGVSSQMKLSALVRRHQHLTEFISLYKKDHRKKMAGEANTFRSFPAIPLISIMRSSHGFDDLFPGFVPLDQAVDRVVIEDELIPAGQCFFHDPFLCIDRSHRIVVKRQYP